MPGGCACPATVAAFRRGRADAPARLVEGYVYGHWRVRIQPASHTAGQAIESSPEIQQQPRVQRVAEVGQLRGVD
jgi:hypothetical protein